MTDPNARNVFTGELLDMVEGEKVRGVGLVNASPAKGVSVLGNRYVGRGNFGLNSYSTTNTRRAATKYGQVNYDAAENYIKNSQLHSDTEKNEAYKIIKRLKELDKEFDPSKSNTQGKINLNSKEEIEYIEN